MTITLLHLIKMKILLFYVTIIVFKTVFGAESPPGNLTNLNICKVTHLGLEYLGHTAKSESSIRCQSWTSSTPHKIRDNILDKNFPEGSKKRAKNYCRNPDKNPEGPWCYTMALDLSYETCGIPLCRFTECRITGPGMEYSGVHNKGSSTRNCLKWNKNRNKVKEKGSYTSIQKYKNVFFPDGTISDAKKYCRNPSGDVGGPWCFVEDEDSGEIQREYCDIPFCDDPECLVFSKDSNTYMHYTDFNDTLTNLTFGVKLWNPDNYLEANARIVLSVLPLPLTGDEISDAGVGIEIFIGNNYSALRYGNKDTPEFEETFGILKATSFTMFSLTWHNGFITFGHEGKTKPIFLAEYKTKKNLLGYKMNKFNYYSVQGTNILWSFPFCKDDFECDAHTTTGKEFQQFWPLREKGAGFDLYVYIRAHHSASILFVLSPVIEYPYVKLTLSALNDFTRISIKDHIDAPERLLFEIQLSNLLDYWSWKEFSISFFTNIMSIYVEKTQGLQSITEVTDDVFRNVRWFSVSSENTIAHWSFFCVPPPASNPPQAFLPECALNGQELHYKGTQDVTDTGLPCVPWSSTSLIGEEIQFTNTTPLEARNYCRDPTEAKEGTYCFALSLSPYKTVSKTFCKIRKCKSEQCRLAGTGNDYSGTLSKTRSNRTCIGWVPKTFKKPYINTNDTNATTISPILIPRDFRQRWNDSLFPENSAKKAMNYCRNPSRNPSGSWCYTTDGNILEDACNIKDCDKPEECTVIVSSTQKARKIIILPKWKEAGHYGGLRFSIKEWNPDYQDGVSIRIAPTYGAASLILQIAADDNQKIKLYKDDKLIEQKTMPHLIGSGRWTDFWLQIRKGEVILGLEGVPTSLFEWTSHAVQEEFEPMFLSYTSINGYPIGISFKCNECHTENCTTMDFQHYFPIGLWSEEQFNNLTLLLRGTGYVIIKLMRLIDINDYYKLVLDVDDNEIGLYRVNKNNKVSILHVEKVSDIMTTNSWTKYGILFNETHFLIKRDDVTIFDYISRVPLVMYWFSIAPQVGWVTWAANCEPLDLDGPPRDGGWSPWSKWSCTSPCGGGDGYRTRTCSNPSPNIFGMLCVGPATSTGKCNQFPCGDVNPETLEKIRTHLQHQAFSYIAKEGSEQLLQNDAEILKEIAKDSPKSYYEWTLNGVFIKPEPDRVIFNEDDIIIKYILPRDAGLYICMLFRINKQRVVIRVISLAVVSNDYNYDTRATRPLHLQCNAVLLGYIYTDLSLKLYRNNKLFLDHGTTTLAAVNSHFFNELEERHSGDWKCVVEQKDLKLSWVTNYIRINVKKAPNIYTNLMEDELTKPIFGWMQSETMVLFGIIFIVFIVVGLVAVFLILYKKHCTLRTSRYQRNRK